MHERSPCVTDPSRLERALSRKASALQILQPIGFVDAHDNERPGLIEHRGTGVQLDTETLAPGAVVAEIVAHGERAARAGVVRQLVAVVAEEQGA